MKKARKGFGNPERSEFKHALKSPKNLWLVQVDIAHEEGDFDSRLGTHKQSMDAPYKRSRHYEWNEGSGVRYDYRKTGKYRRTHNAKAKKAKGKKYYRKARNNSENAVTKPSTVSGHAIFAQREYELHLEYMQFRGGYYAHCKGCELPMHHGAMHNSDMAVCYDCADDLWWIEDWFLEYDYDREDEERARLAS